jgi:hypothetical protein
MKIIFLDVDGVALTGKSHMLDGNIRTRLALNADLGDGVSKHDIRVAYCLAATFDQFAIMLINRLAEKSGAKIVIHSNWRRSVGHVDTKAKLVKEGIREEFFHQDYYCKMRMTSSKQTDIDSWLDEHRVSERPKQPTPRLMFEEGYDQEAQSLWHRDVQEYGIEYVIVDDESISNSGWHDCQVYPDFYDGFTLELYRLACGMLRTVDHQLDVHLLSKDELSKVAHHFSDKRKMNYWLYSLSDNKGYTAPRATLLSFLEAKRVNEIPNNPFYGIREVSTEYLYQKRSGEIWNQLSAEFYLKKKHPLIVEFGDLTEMTGVCTSDFENTPKDYPCIFVGTKDEPVYVYAPDDCLDSMDYLYGYAAALEALDFPH